MSRPRSTAWGRFDRKSAPHHFMIPYDTGIAGWSDVRRILLRLLVMLGDAFCVIAAYTAAFYIRFYAEPFLISFPAVKGIPSFFLYVRALPVILFMWILVLSWDDAYSRFSLPALDELI